MCEYIIASKGRAVAAEANERLRHKHSPTLYPTFIPFPFFLDCYKPELRALIIHSLSTIFTELEVKPTIFDATVRQLCAK